MATVDVTRRVPIALMIASVLMLGAAAAALALKPTHLLADEKPAIVLESLFPQSFGRWRIDTSVTPVVADPTVQAKIDSIYSQTLSRTYINDQGERVMLSIAYGRNQNSESTAAHRPEFCYTAQGFAVQGKGQESLQLATHSINVKRLVATWERRVEPITYWVTLADQASVPGFGRKLQQLRYGLRGFIVDGMLFRLSSISADGQTLDYQLHDNFARELEQMLPPAFRPRFFGA